jgi:hypothetical protein
VPDKIRHYLTLLRKRSTHSLEITQTSSAAYITTLSVRTRVYILYAKHTIRARSYHHYSQRPETLHPRSGVSLLGSSISSEIARGNDARRISANRLITLLRIPAPEFGIPLAPVGVMRTTQGSELSNPFAPVWVPMPESTANKGEEVICEMGGHCAGHPEADHLKAYALRQLPRGHSITVDFHLRMCASCDIQLQEIRASIGHWTGVEKLPRFGAENRKSVRVPTDDLAVLRVLRPEPSGHIDTRVLDTSKEGLKLFIPRELLKGTVVQIHLRDLFILAEVRYCRSFGTGFHAGVLIQDVFATPGCPIV